MGWCFFSLGQAVEVEPKAKTTTHNMTTAIRRLLKENTTTFNMTDKQTLSDTKESTTVHQKAKVVKLRKLAAPKIDVKPDTVADDYVGSVGLLDYTWTYVSKYAEDFFKYIRPKIPDQVTDYNLKIILVVTYSLAVVLIIRFICPLPTLVLIGLTRVSIV